MKIMKIAITTDTNAGIKQNEFDCDNLFVLPMPFLIDGNEYFEEVNLGSNQFFEFQLGGSNISTSQPSIASVQQLWQNALKQFDCVIHIPMSSSLSSSCDTAKMLANEEEFKGKVFVVDNQRISVTQKQSVADALLLTKQGKSAKEIVNYLETTKKDSTIYILVPDLKYLKKGGRITSAVAAIATILKIKPILQIQGGKLDSYAKVINTKMAKEKMISAIKKDIESRFTNLQQNQKLQLAIAYTYDKSIAEDFMQDVKNAIPDLEIMYVDPLSLSVSCHIGPNALALAMSVVVK